MGNDPDGILVKETPYVIVVPTREELDADHVIDGMLWKLQFTID